MLLYIFFFLLTTSATKAQDSLQVFTIVEQMPEFNGGTLEMMRYIQKNVRYPSYAMQSGLSGKSYIKFIVDSTGKIQRPEILKSSGYEILDAEALRVVNTMPDWKPGKQNDKNVSVAYNLPISFSVSGQFAITKPGDIKSEEYILGTGIIYLNAGFFEKSISYFDKCITLDKRNNVTWLNKGSAYYNLKNEREACDCWKEAYKLGNKEAEDFMNKYCSELKEVLEPTEKMPEFPNGMGELMSFIQKNIKYPEGVKKSDVSSSKVYLKFVVNSDGSLSNIEINKGSGNNFVDEEAKRIVSIMPKWNPGIQNGKKVPVYFNLPISFSKYN